MNLGRGWSPDQAGNGMKSGLGNPSCKRGLNRHKNDDISEIEMGNERYSRLPPLLCLLCVLCGEWEEE